MELFRNYRVWFALAAVFAAAAAAATVGAVKAWLDLTPAVAAARDIREGQAVTAQMLAAVEVPSAAAYPDAVRSPREIAGWVARGPIPAGTVLRKSMFSPPGAWGVSGRLAELGGDLVAVAVPAGLETTVAGALKAGDRVDVYAKPAAKGGGGAAAPEKLASDVLVLQGAAGSQGEAARGVILALSRQDLEKVLPRAAEGLVFVLLPKAEEGGGPR